MWIFRLLYALQLLAVVFEIFYRKKKTKFRVRVRVLSTATSSYDCLEWDLSLYISISGKCYLHELPRAVEKIKTNTTQDDNFKTLVKRHHWFKYREKIFHGLSLVNTQTSIHKPELNALVFGYNITT